MNDAGEVAGNSYLPGDEVRHAVLWRSGKIIDLGTVGADPCSDAHGLNIRGQVVGSSHDCIQEMHGFLWQLGGPMIDLNAFVPPDSDLTITDGHTINDSGEIIASGMLPNGDFHAILLVPCGSNPADSDGCRDVTAPVAVSNQFVPMTRQQFQRLFTSSMGRSPVKRWSNGGATIQSRFWLCGTNMAECKVSIRQLWHRKSTKM
jgi:probable HAF family extracellular repeat protein